VAAKGHADRVGDQGMNLRLSLQRTAAVKAALMGNGVQESAIQSGGLGEENLPIPTADNVPERLNRSVHITVTGGRS
jgi:OOP family OmpA-OmpF porin